MAPWLRIRRDRPCSIGPIVKNIKEEFFGPPQLRHRHRRIRPYTHTDSLGCCCHLFDFSLPHDEKKKNAKPRRGATARAHDRPAGPILALSRHCYLESEIFSTCSTTTRLRACRYHKIKRNERNQNLEPTTTTKGDLIPVLSSAQPLLRAYQPLL